MKNKLIDLNSFFKIDISDAKLEKSNKSDKKALIVDLEVSASGKVTNGRIYPPKGHQNGIKSWIEPFRKPVQVYHDSGKDPIGRFVAARWESTEDKALKFLDGDYKALSEIKRAFDSGDVKAIYKTMKKYNAFSPKWPGLGRVVGKIRVTDQDAIEKLIDERYLTWSAGQNTDAFVCMHCNVNWRTEGSCEHTFGGVTEDGEPVIFLCGNMYGKEVSVVNNPGNDTSLTIGMQLEDGEDNAYPTISITDSLDDLPIIIPNINIESEKNMKLQDLEGLEIETVLDILSDEEKVNEFLDALNGDSHYEVRWLVQMHDALHHNYDYQLKYRSDDEEDRIPQAVFKLHGALHDISMQKNFRDSMLNGTLDEFSTGGQKTGEYKLTKDENNTKVEINDVLTQLKDFLKETKEKENVIIRDEEKEKVKDQVLETISDDNKDDIVEDESIDWEMLDLALQSSVTEDAKLSTEKRNELPAKSFCGPDRSFPVPDCAHVTAARRLVGRSKLTADQKEKVLACVNRKAKTMSCDSSEDKASCKCKIVGEKYNDLKQDYGKALLDLEKAKEKYTTAISKVAKAYLSEDEFGNMKKDELISWFDSKDFDTKEEVVKDSTDKAETELKPIADQKESTVDHTTSATVDKAQFTKFEQTVYDKYTAKLKDNGAGVANAYLNTVLRYLSPDFVNNLSNLKE